MPQKSEILSINIHSRCNLTVYVSLLSMQIQTDMSEMGALGILLSRCGKYIMGKLKSLLSFI